MATPEFTRDSRFRLESRQLPHLGGGLLATLPARNIQGEWKMDAVDELRFSLPLYDPKVTRQTVYAGECEIYLFRDNKRIFAGPLWGATASSDSQTLTCSAESLESYLFDTRRIDADSRYDKVEQADIVWSLVDASQSLPYGSLNITRGVFNHGANEVTKRQVQWKRFEMKHIGDAINELSLMESGFNWEIDANRELNMWHPRRGGTSTTVLEFGGNMTGYSVQYMGKYHSNSHGVRGPGTFAEFGENKTQQERLGLRQKDTPLQSAKSPQELKDRLVKELVQRGAVLVIPQVVLKPNVVDIFNLDVIELGDIVRVRVDDGYVQYDEDMRYVGHQLTVGEHDEETIVVYLNDLREVEDVAS